MNELCLVIDTDELSYSLHDQGCARLSERASAAKFLSLAPEREDALARAQQELLPSWQFRPCHCLDTRGVAAAG